jgi:hypothetical protein
MSVMLHFNPSDCPFKKAFRQCIGAFQAIKHWEGSYLLGVENRYFWPFLLKKRAF